jgi:hypothetical protein
MGSDCSLQPLPPLPPLVASVALCRLSAPQLSGWVANPATPWRPNTASTKYRVRKYPCAMAQPGRRISPNAYRALREALPIVFFYKRPYESYLRTALRDAPSILAGTNFSDLKRVVADHVVESLQVSEDVYQDVAIELMLSVAAMERFPDLEGLDDAEVRVAEARAAVAEMARLTAQFEQIQAAQQQGETARQSARERAAESRAFADELRGLKERFLELAAMDNKPQVRGHLFEGFLAQLFTLFDLEPRLAYVLPTEQIDGSVTFDTDDYIVEARWRMSPASRADADAFAAKVRRKGKNALGLFLSVSGFSSDLLAVYADSTPFIAVDGADLVAVLEERVRLDDLLRRKKRHANETGHCFLPVAHIAVSPTQ